MIHSPPASVKGMLVLDRSLFTTVVSVPSLVFGRTPDLSAILRLLKPHFLTISKIKPVQFNDADVVVLLKGPITTGDDKNIVFLDQAISNIFKTTGVCPTVKQTLLTLTYNNWTYDDIFSAVLPDGLNISGYTLTGHVLHLNLKEDLDPYKGLIGQVLLDKVPSCRTVVNKTKSIDSKYRNFEMEILAGDQNLVTRVKEHGCLFELDFAAVFWNSRLSTEHQRLVNIFQRDESVYDVFAGVGPFAIPAAKKGCRVIANDLNEHSVQWLRHNAKLNHVSLQTHNMDGADFIRTVCLQDLQDRKEHGVTHFILNLPALAPTFLSCFSSLVAAYIEGQSSMDLTLIERLRIHCYCFCKDAEDSYHEARRLVCEHLGSELDDRAQCHFVRNVAPNKDMMCVSFSLPSGLLHECERQKQSPNAAHCAQPLLKSEEQPLHKKAKNE